MDLLKLISIISNDLNVENKTFPMSLYFFYCEYIVQIGNLFINFEKLCSKELPQR